MLIKEKLSQVVEKNAKDRPIIFSSFIPDAAQLVKKLQRTYPVRSFTYLILFYIFISFFIFHFVLMFSNYGGCIHL